MQQNALRRMPATAQAAVRPFIYRSADHTPALPHPLRRSNDTKNITVADTAPQALFAVVASAPAVLIQFRIALKKN